MTPTIMRWILIIIFIHLFTSCSLMWKAGLICEKEGSYVDFQLPTGGFELLYLYLRLCFNSFLHLLNMALDVLYFFTVPMYHKYIRLLMFIFLLPPAVLFLLVWIYQMLTWFCCKRKHDRVFIFHDLLIFLGALPIWKLYRGETDKRVLWREDSIHGIVFLA